MKASAKITTLILMSIFSVGAWAADTITSISPNSGPITGGQTIRLRGTFAASPSVSVGTNLATITGTPTASVIDIITPAGSAGIVNITVNGGTAQYTYIARNNQLQVVVSASIAKRVLLQWGATTSTDDAGTPHASGAGLFSPFAWTVRDNGVLPAGQIELSTSYRSDDANNDKQIFVRNASTGTAVSISAIATEIGPFSLVGTIAANDQVRILGSLGAGTLTSLHNLQSLSGSVAASTEQPLVLQFDSPQGLTGANFAQTYTFTITLTAAAL